MFTQRFQEISCLRTTLPFQDERHIGFVRFGPMQDDFGDGFSGDGIEQLVLGFGKKHLGGLVGFVVVAAQGEQIPDLLVKALFRGPDIPDAFQQFIKVVGCLPSGFFRRSSSITTR
jgi:hypothetical protein